MWTNVPVSEHQGPHIVDVPEEFGKTPDDFESPAEFLQALREFRESNTKEQLCLI